MTTTTTTVLHDAHVACRAALPAQAKAFVGAYQSVCCFIAAVACACVARRAVRADRVTARAANHAAAKAVRAANVARKEAAEQYASRVSRRAAAKAAAAPTVRAAKLHAAMVAKAIKAANAVRLDAVRAQRAAAKVAPVIKATMVAIDKAYALSVAPCGTTVVAPATVNVYSIVAFLAMTPCLAALWFIATFNIAAKAADKEANKVANKAAAAVKAPRARLNDAAKRADITSMYACARATVLHAQAKSGTSISNAKVQARLAQGAAQKAANEARKAGTTKVARPQVVIVRSGPAKNKGAKRVRVVRVHTVESALAQVAKKAAIIKAKEDAQILKAKKWALRKEAYANRKAAMEVIASDAWMMKGVWLPEDLIRAANDWSYEVRISAFKEARNIAYAKAPAAKVAVAA